MRKRPWAGNIMQQAASGRQEFQDSGLVTAPNCVGICNSDSPILEMNWVGKAISHVNLGCQGCHQGFGKGRGSRERREGQALLFSFPVWLNSVPSEAVQLSHMSHSSFGGLCWGGHFLFLFCALIRTIKGSA